METQLIYECQIALPSLKRAERLVPEQFLPCWQWFIDHEGDVISRLPHNMKNPPKLPLALSRLSGIHSPGEDKTTGKKLVYRPGRRYALSVHTGNSSKYHDKRPVSRLDGTWLIEYEAHSGKDTVMDYNSTLMNCLVDGIPVGVFFGRKGGGYDVMGLAFVERYNSLTESFTLHGPVNAATVGNNLFATPGFDELPKEKQLIIADADEILSQEDERKIVQARQVRRQQQDTFREKLFSAYGGACAITATDVPEVLQAAHIDPYRGPKSQVTSNGILLRSDLHLLYDAHLISIEPDSYKLVLSERLRKSRYASLQGERIRLPENAADIPNARLLQEHLSQFLQLNKPLVA